MFLAHHFPGLSLVIERLLRHDPESPLEQLTPEETNALIRAGEKTLKANTEDRWAHTKILVQASGARLGF
jgi:hypothetical protein